MRRTSASLLAVALVTTALIWATPPVDAAPPTSVGPTVWTAEVTPAEFNRLGDLGLDRSEIIRSKASDGRIKIEVVIGSQEAAKVSAAGIDLKEKTVDGVPARRQLARQAANGYTVFRSYSEPGGIRDELIDIVRTHPKLTKLVSIGRTVQGKDILAVKVTADAQRVRDGQRPATLYVSAQHAREWITPEMNRRLLHHMIDGFSTDTTIRRLLSTTELWFVPVANPDGYDYTFTPGHRLWRKNLRDNDGDGVITDADGVDPNRNFPYRWGYDNEGSSPVGASETFRGTGPASEPETRALDRLMKQIGFSYLVNYHSAAQLLLSGVGWQVATPSPDDVIQNALAGTDENSAIPGYDPDLSADLYTTNGETDGQAHERRGTLSYTPEMSTCQTASAIDPDDAFDPDDCVSVFNFPDSEALIQAEFEKNIPFALAVARSAQHPDRPVGVSIPDFVTDSFAVSYGDPQPVAVTARRDLRDLTMSYSINGGRTYRVPVREWRGGERYGRDGTLYYAEFRGVVRGARPGDSVRVWFSGRRPGQGRTVSDAFTYRLAEKTRHRVLVVADEDYRGVNPTYPSTVTGPKYAAAHVAALKAAGYDASLWDVTRQGVPHHLGVLGHFDAVVWYLGDNRLTQDPEDEFTDVLGQQFPDAAVAERAEYLTIAVRDYLNEGGKLVHAGETAGYFGTLGSALGGIYYGLDGDASTDCVVSEDPYADCQILSDDFFQYYLGAYSRSPVALPKSFAGAAELEGVDASLGGAATSDNPLNEAGTFSLTGDVLPPSQFPLFASHSVGRYRGADGGAFDPVEGSWYAGLLHQNDSYARLTRTVDLTGVSGAGSPALTTQISFDTEEGYDHVIVEAHPVGSDAWTTLSEAGGLTSTAVPTECEVGFLIGEHPFLTHYLTPGDPCSATGTTGSWNAMTGSSGGWQRARFDLSAFAGQQVEISIAYVSDPGSGGAGVVVDDTAVVVNGEAVVRDGFEAGLGGWSVTGPPAGSPAGGARFTRSQGLFAAGVGTADSVVLGFGLEQVASESDRSLILQRSLRQLLRRP